MRTFSGAEQFEALKKSVTDVYSKLFPVARFADKPDYSLHLKKIWVDDASLDPHDYTAQKKARLAGNTWGAPVFADLELKDPTGKIVDQMSKIRLATIPRLTPRGSYIVNGNEYQFANQMRRKMGVYVQRRSTGDQYKAVFNLGGEGARNFEIHLDPATNKYSVTIGQGKLPLYPLLQGLGVSDQAIKSAWGNEIFEANKVKPEKYLKKYSDRLARVKTENPQSAVLAIQEFAKKVHVDPSITEITLGKKFNHLHPEAVLSASKKLMDVYHQKQNPDDPENLLFKEVLSVEDMLHDKLTHKKTSADLKNMLTRHLGKRMKIKEIVDFKKLSGPVEAFFTRDDRSSTPEQYNPVHMLSEMHKLTLMGTGGIKDPHTVADEVREVHPSHVGFIDPVHTPEGEKIGVTLHLTTGAVKDGREVRTRVINVRTGQIELLTPQELYKKTVAFPDEGAVVNGKVKFHSATVRAQRLGKLNTFRQAEIDYILPSHTTLFGHSTNLVPFLQNNQGNRTMMAAKMLGQAIPLVHREAPLVQTDAGDGTSFHKLIGSQFAIHSPVDGKVTKVTADHIEIGKHKIPLYNDFPLNQKTYLHHEPLVKVGDSVKKGQLVADSNFTKGGTLALGKNMLVAYLPYPGLTFEDGIVITESAAKKLATQQIYKHSFELDQGARITDFNKFTAFYPNQVNKAHQANFDKDGVIKKGTVVRPGDTVIMGLKYDLDRPENMTLKRINKALIKPWSNASQLYTGEFEGVVSDVVKRANRVDVYVKAIETARASDKLSGVHGNKGVITKVIPDSEAPRLKDGRVPDVLLNPHGIIGRINIGQIYESAAGKIAQKTGKPFLVRNFSGEKMNEKVSEEMKKHGITDMEEMVLPNGKPLGKVHVGQPYILRLAKTGKTGFSARMPGAGYDLNLQPTKGGEEGSKAMDLMTFYSMLSHGAKKNLVDAHQKSEKNDEYWHAIETGKPLPAPKQTFAFRKFISLLHGAGINTVKQGANIVLSPLTDTVVKQLSRGEIKEPEFFYGKDMREKKGGFYDPIITGGRNGEHYAHIELKEPVPNPIFERPIQILTGLSKDQYHQVVSGTLHVAPDGKLVTTPTAQTKTGGFGIKKLLGQIDIQKDIQSVSNKVKTAKNPTELNLLNKKLRYLHALQELKLSPEEAYLRKVVPVVPPVHRPVIEMPGQAQTVAPVNYLYQNLGLINQSHDYPVMKLLADSEKKELRADLYNTTKQLAGLEDLMVRGTSQPIKGFISQITGNSPKMGFFLNKVINKRQDLVGRGVITAAPDLHVDQLGIPEKMAWKIFRPFVVREYTMNGVTPDTARKEIEEQNPRAKQMLQAAMGKRTVLMNRAPSLHKFSIMAFKPVLSDGLAIRVPPLVLKGFGGDFDGDAVTIHVPTSEEALRESHKMLPSQNLVKPGTGELMMVPSQESAIGLYFLSHTAEGRKKINSVLPSKYHVTESLDSKKATKLYERIVKESPQDYHKFVSDLKLIGDKEAYERGFSVGVKDVHVNAKVRDQIFQKADAEVERLKRLHKGKPDLDHKIAEIYQKAAQDSYRAVEQDLKKQDNGFYHMVHSGARGKPSQLQQLIVAPGVVEDSKGRPVPVPLKTSYAEGLKTSDYFVASYGVRKGMIDKSLQTSKPGALNKDIMSNTIDNIITIQDCGTSRGIMLPIDSPDVYDRVTLHSRYKGQIVTPQMITQLKKQGEKQIQVRSPLKCVAPKGTCAMCYGLDEHGHLPQLGENVGAKSGQTMSEPMTQMSMKCSITNVIFKYKNKVHSRSLEDMFEIIDAPIEQVDGRDTKRLNDVYIWDMHGWVETEYIQRHLPDVPLHFLKTDTGDAVLVQSDHPIFVYEQPTCICGYHVNTNRFENKSYLVSECTRCKRVKTTEKSKLSDSEQIKTVSEVIEKSDSLWVSKRIPKAMVTTPPVDPYILGFYLAEGCIGSYKTCKNGPKYKNFVALSQNPGKIRDYLAEKLNQASIRYSDAKGALRVHSRKFSALVSELCPGLAHEKRMNFDFLFLPDQYLAAILAGLIDGDGTIARKNKSNSFVKIYTSSFILAQQISMISSRLGLSYNLASATKPKHNKIKHIAQPYVVDIRIDHNAAYLLRESHKIKNNIFDSRVIYKNKVLFGPSVVTKNKVTQNDYPQYTYDVKTKTAGFMAGFVRNHNTFHTGGVVGGGPSMVGFNRIRQLLHLPDHLPHAAVQSQLDGKVTQVKKTSSGVTQVFVGDKMHAIPANRELKVRVGDMVQAGDPLSHGVLKPQELKKLKGMEAAQNYLVDELHKTYSAQGAPVQRKVFETVVRSVGNWTRVMEAPKHGDFTPGELVPYTTAVHYNETRAAKMPTHDAVGYRLRNKVGTLPQFHTLTDKDISYLKGLGYNQIDVVKDPLVHAPVLKSIERLSKEKKNWMAQLGYRYIEDTLTEGAAEAWKTQLEGTHPIPAYAFGATFGKKKEHY